MMHGQKYIKVSKESTAFLFKVQRVYLNLQLTDHYPINIFIVYSHILVCISLQDSSHYLLH